MDQVFRSLRRLAVAGGILLAIVAPPAQALACGMGLDFRQTIHDSPIVVIAQSQGRAQGKEVLTVNRVPRVVRCPSSGSRRPSFPSRSGQGTDLRSRSCIPNTTTETASAPG